MKVIEKKVKFKSKEITFNVSFPETYIEAVTLVNENIITNLIRKHLLEESKKAAIRDHLGLPPKRARRNILKISLDQMSHEKILQIQKILADLE